MRILVCAVEAPSPPTSGFRLLLAELLQELRERHEVRVLALRAADQREDPAEQDGVRLVSQQRDVRVLRAVAVGAAMMRGRPMTPDLLARALRQPLEEELKRFRPDVVHVTSGRLAALGPVLRGRSSVLAALDAWHLNVEARARIAGAVHARFLRSEARRVRSFECDEYHRFGQVVVVSDADAAALRSVCGPLDVTVVPNGVDAARYAPAGGEPHPHRIVFTGVMSYAPNVLAAEFLARRVFPLVQHAVPQARLAIVGRNPSPRVQSLAEIDGVDVTGEVPDIRPWLTDSRVYACPMISGTGIKNKLLEALACGVPCVATPLALQGMTARHGQELLVGDGEEELAAHLVDVLGDEETARRLGRAARAYVLEHHDWAAVARAYEAVYDGVMGAAWPTAARVSPPLVAGGTQ